MNPIVEVLVVLIAAKVLGVPALLLLACYVGAHVGNGVLVTRRERKLRDAIIQSCRERIREDVTEEAVGFYLRAEGLDVDPDDDLDDLEDAERERAEAAVERARRAVEEPDGYWGSRADDLVDAACRSDDLWELEEAGVEPLQQAVIVMERTWLVRRELALYRELGRRWGCVGGAPDKVMIVGRDD